MLRVRLTRTGKKHAPSFRIVVGPHSRDLEVLGSYNPQLKPASFKVDKERLEYWVSKGAKLTDAVESLLEGKYEFKPYVRREEKVQAEEETSESEAVNEAQEKPVEKPKPEKEEEVPESTEKEGNEKAS